MLLPCVREVTRASLAAELESLRMEISSLVLAVQALTETESSGTRDPARAPPNPHRSRTAPPAAVLDVASAHRVRKSENNVCVQTPNPEVSRSTASSHDGRMAPKRILKEAGVASASRLLWRKGATKSARSLTASKTPSVQELEAQRARELLGSPEPAGRSKQLDSQLSGVVPRSAPSSHKEDSQAVYHFGVSSRAGENSRVLKRTETLRQLREAQLVSVDDEHPLEPVTSLCFSALGIFPWNRMCRPGSSYLRMCSDCASVTYQWGVFGIMLVSVAYCAMQAFLGNEFWLAPGLVSDLSVALGGMASFIAVGALWNSGDILACFKLMSFRTWDCDCLNDWVRGSRQEHLISFCVWTFAVISKAVCVSVWMSPSWHASDTRLVFSVLPFALCSGMILAVSSCMAQTSLGLAALVDGFCSCFVETKDIEHSVHEWNVLQAMLRTACLSVQRCYLVLHVVVAGAMLLSAADFAVKFDDIWEAASLMPLMIIIVAVMRVLFNAAEVTSKCGRVPAFINSLDFGKKVDADRQYIVDYVIQSAAGFYAYEVRITSFLEFKFIYLSLVLAVALANELSKQ